MLFAAVSDFILVPRTHFLSVSDIWTWELMFSCIFRGKIQVGLWCLIIKNFHVKTSHNLSLHFWHDTFWEPRTFTGTQLCPDLLKMLYFSYLCVKFQPTDSIISINFAHFASSFNYVRGVIYCTLWDHCTAIFEPNELKFMRFWKSFESSFRWDQPNLYALKYSKFINSQSWMVLSPKKSIFTVLWEITVLPFLNEMSWNPWDSERVLKDLSDEINHIFFLLSIKKL